MILLPGTCDINGHILRRVRLRRFRALHQHRSTSAVIAPVVIAGYPKYSPDRTVVTHSKVRSFIVVSKIRFIKSVNAASTEILRDSIRLEVDVVCRKDWYLRCVIFVGAQTDESLRGLP